MLKPYKGKDLSSKDLDIFCDAIMDTKIIAGRCLSQKHDEIISNQKAAITELRYTISTLEESTTSYNVPNFALHRISTLKKANEVLEAKVASGILASKQRLIDIADQKLHDEINRLTELLDSSNRKLTEEQQNCKQQQEDLHSSEKLFFKCIRDINSELDIKYILGHTPLIDGCDRTEVTKERNKGIEVIINNIGNLKLRIKRQEELLGSYDLDMKNFRELEKEHNKMSIHVKYLESEVEEKHDEISYLQEALRKSRDECADLKRMNSSRKQNKKFAMDYKEK